MFLMDLANPSHKHVWATKLPSWWWLLEPWAYGSTNEVATETLVGIPYKRRWHPIQCKNVPCCANPTQWQEIGWGLCNALHNLRQWLVTCEMLQWCHHHGSCQVMMVHCQLMPRSFPHLMHTLHWPQRACCKALELGGLVLLEVDLWHPHPLGMK